MTHIEKKDRAFKYEIERFADVRILKYQVPGFEDLELKQKLLVYYLSEAAKCGRDILADQNCKYNLLVRRFLENIYVTYQGEKEHDGWKAFAVYLKRVWFSNGIHHHYSNDKFTPGFSQPYFETLIQQSASASFPLLNGKTLEETAQIVNQVIFDPSFMAKKIEQKEGLDIVKNSAVNFYSEDIAQEEVEQFYQEMKDESDPAPVSHGLNSTLKKANGKIYEDVWKVGGKYSQAIEHIVKYLEKALAYAETPEQKEGLEMLVNYYKTGDLKQWDAYNINWVNDLKGQVDYVNGFIEVYSDPMGMKATWEAIVNFKDEVATQRTQTISENAQWFEDHSPIDEAFKKKEVKGVSAKVITMAMLGGDCYPHTPIGINLPNADWIRSMHGSKSVTIENITHAYAQADLESGFLEEFSASEEDMEREKKYGTLADNLHTDLHECLGHGSGQLLPGVSSEALKNYHSPLEETRADLFALYYMMDEKMLGLGLIPSLDAAKAHYTSYIRNGLMTQLRRIEPGENIQQAHMRNRQLISKWCYEHGKANKVIEIFKRENKTFIKINDYYKLQKLFATLLKEVQRIKSEGDYNAGKKLVESYGVQVDKDLHLEVLERFEKIGLPAFSGFVNPEYTLVEKEGEIMEVALNYIDDYAAQMLKYSTDYSFLSTENN